MIRTLIVDDDVEMLIGLTNIINWNRYGFKLVGQAENGVEALEILKVQEIDLIITDISMPSMDGLELIRQAKMIYPLIRSIILTCHKEFDYAKEAIGLEAEDYVLKYTLTDEELITVLNKVKYRIKSDEQKRISLEKANERFIMNHTAIKNRFYKDITEGAFRNRESIIKKAHQNNINIPLDKYRIISIHILNGDITTNLATIQEGSQKKICMDNMLGDIAATYKDKDIFWRNDEMQVMVIWEQDLLNEIGQSIQIKLKTYSNKVKEILNMPIAICISKVFEGIEGLNTAFLENENLTDGFFYSGEKLIIKNNVSFKQTDAYSLYHRIESELKTALQAQDKVAASILESLFHTIVHEQYEPKCVVKLIRMIIVDIKFVAKDYNINLEEQERQANTLNGWKEILYGMIETIVKAKQIQKYRKEIIETLAYMNNHLHEAINCETMADKANMNRSYFSRIFKHELGMSFTDYLMKIRIEKATMLLKSTDLSNEEISKRIGLENVTYFYKIYRRIEGITPGEVRKSMMKNKKIHIE